METTNLNKTTQKAQRYIQQYENSYIYRLWRFYKTSYSYDKQDAEDYIIEKMGEHGGTGYRILGGNGFYFTAAWRLNNDLVVETYKNTYLIKDAFKE